MTPESTSLRKPLRKPPCRSSDSFGSFGSLGSGQVNVSEYNAMKSAVSSLARKAQGSLVVRDLSSDVRPDQVRPPPSVPPPPVRSRGVGGGDFPSVFTLTRRSSLVEAMAKYGEGALSCVSPQHVQLLHAQHSKQRR